MSTFTNIKDVDLKILSELDDKSLFQACSVNRYLFRICNAEPSFWRNRYVKKYGEKAAQYKPRERSWKNHYMQTVIDLERFKNDSVAFLDYIAWGGSVEKSFFIWEGKLIPFLEAPEWVMTNFWLLDLGEINIDSDLMQDFILQYTTYSHLKPFELLNKLWTGDYIVGLQMYAPDRYMTNLIRRENLKYIATLRQNTPKI